MAKSQLGWSTDHIKEILYHYPLALNGFLCLLQLITNGELDTETRDLIFCGRGIPLQQRNKIRPIIIQCPFHKVASHILIQNFNSMAIELCGNRQLGNGIKGGVEILVHSIRLLLELNPEWVILKTDIKNAFNEISRNAIINTVNNSANELLHYTNCFLK